MITKVINVNLHQPIYEKLTAKRGDIASRYLLFHLLDGDKPFDLTNRSVRVYAVKPDKTVIFNDLTINDRTKGYCTLELTSQCLALAGTVKMELYILESDKVLTSIPFRLQVIDCINTDDSIVSTNEFTALTKGLSSLSEYDNYKNEIAEARNGFTTLGKRLYNIDVRLDTKATNEDLAIERSRIDLLTKVPVGDTEGNAELLDIRIDKNGTTHDTAGDATRITILDDNSVSANKIAGEYTDVLLDTKMYINQYQKGYFTDTGLIDRGTLAGHTCTDFIPISLLGDEITMPLDDGLEGQAFIFLDENKKAYYSKSAEAVKINKDMQEYLIYDDVNKEYTLLIKKYSQNEGRVAYVSFNFLTSRKYIKRLADEKMLKWLKVENNNLTKECVLPNHISNSEYLKDFTTIKNAYMGGYTPRAISYVNSHNQVSTCDLGINEILDTIKFKVTSTLQGQVIILKNNDGEYFGSLNATLIRSRNFRMLTGYMTYDDATEMATLDIKKIREENDTNSINKIAISSDTSVSIKGFAYKELKWLKVGSNNLSNECVLPNHISNTEYLKDFTTIKNAYMGGYTPSAISYVSSHNQVSTYDLSINELSDELEFKVTSTLQGQVIILKDNRDEYFAGLNATLIRRRDFRMLTGYITYDDATEMATLDIKKIREEMLANNINKIAISSDVSESIKGFVYKDLKWIRTSNNTDLREEREERKEEKIEIRLLDEYVLLKDVEYNFYTSQTVLCSRKLDEKYMVVWQYDGDGGTAYNDFLRIQEVNTGVNKLTLKVLVEEDGIVTLVDSKTATINIVENNVTNKKLLFIGDSRIEDGCPPWTPRAQLVTSMKNTLDASNTFLGSRGGGSLANHEGRSGWRCLDYCRKEYDSNRNYNNEFYNPNFTDTLDGLTSHFDFNYYMTNSGYDTVDLVGIYLGANDVYDDNSIIYQKMMIKSIKSFNPDTKIILFCDYLSPCDNYSLISVGSNYVRRRLSQMAYYEKQKQMVTDLGFSDVYIIGTNSMIDDWYDFNRRNMKISYRNSDSEKIEYIIDVIHPKETGYDKMADLVCGHINHILS